MQKKIFIFDMDGTLYDLNDVVDINYKMQVEFLALKLQITKESAISFLSANGIYPTVSKDSKSATELFLRIGLDKLEWNCYREAHFDVSKINRQNAIDEKIILNFAKYGVLILLSSNSFDNIKKVLNYLDISHSIFTEVVCSDRFPYNVPFKKQLAMKYLSEKYDIPFTDVISIGDRYLTDIEPLLILGGQGILLSRPCGLRDVINDFVSSKLHSCEAYKFYKDSNEN